MPHATVTREAEGWVLSVMVGVNGQMTASLVASGQPVPAPQLLRALLDTGTDVTGVAAGVLSRLGLSPRRRHSTQTLFGSVVIQLFDVSLSVPHPGALTGPLLVEDQLIVMELPAPLAGLDAILGRDISDRLLLILDGPRAECTVAD